jgi:hypothetical protein
MIFIILIIAFLAGAWMGGKSTLRVERRRVKSNIGLMRQWLNEDRITDTLKMVDNDELNHWIDIGQ